MEKDDSLSYKLPKAQTNKRKIFSFDYQGRKYSCDYSDIHGVLINRESDKDVICLLETCGKYKQFKCQKGTGYTNVFKHLSTHHEEIWQQTLVAELNLVPLSSTEFFAATASPSSETDSTMNSPHPTLTPASQAPMSSVSAKKFRNPKFESKSKFQDQIDYERGWQCLQGNRVKDSDGLNAYLDEIGVYDANDLDGINRENAEKIATFLKEAPSQSFKKAMHIL